jgi:hypothetical protein
MTLSARELTKLRLIISLAEEILAVNPNSKRGRPALSSVSGSAMDQRVKRTRRTGKKLVAFRKMLKAELKKGASVAELARKHGISTAYIYMLP